MEITFTDKQTGYIIGAGFYGNQIYKTTDCGKSWWWLEDAISPRVPKPLNDICFSDENNGFIVGDGGVFLKTTDGGKLEKHIREVTLMFILLINLLDGLAELIIQVKNLL